MTRNSSEEFTRVEADTFQGKQDQGYVNNPVEHNFTKPLTQIHAYVCCVLVVIFELCCRTIYVSPRIDDRQHQLVYSTNSLKQVIFLTTEQDLSLATRLTLSSLEPTKRMPFSRESAPLISVS